jgi:hypothetical protein
MTLIAKMEEAVASFKKLFKPSVCMQRSMKQKPKLSIAKAAEQVTKYVPPAAKK